MAGHIKAEKTKHCSHKLDRTEEAELNFYLLQQILSEISDGAQDLLAGQLLYAKHFHRMNPDCMFDLLGEWKNKEGVWTVNTCNSNYFTVAMHTGLYYITNYIGVRWFLIIVQSSFVIKYKWQQVFPQ